MSKIRVYELAKELGVDNKVVIERAKEIGVRGKISHSNSLDADEADQIRRAVIRQAMGVSHDSEVVTKRVDRFTGATSTIVERRKGDVIRRRRQADEVKAPEPVEEETATEAVPEEELESEAAAGIPPEMEIADEEQGAVEAGAEEAAAEEEEIQPAAGEPSVEGAPKKTVGPRVLGRIELPVAKKPAKPEARKPAPVVGLGARLVAPESEEEEEEEGDGKKGGRARKGRKREFSRHDLVDYQGRDGRRTGRTARARGEKPEHEPEAEEAAKRQVTKRTVKLGETITVGDLAKQMSLKAGEIIGKLMEMGMMTTINQMLDKDTATLVLEEFQYPYESTEFDEASAIAETVDDEVDKATQEVRPPVVTVMGHVDHGKTTLLDFIRNASVAAKEAGGITQHIGAYKVTVNDKSITFIDTPGHAAFTAMRARGAEITDIVILVVAADDGVMPQTIEAINHAKAAKVPMVVAVNKMDKPGVNPDRVKQQLAEHGLQPEDWGGDTMFFSVSALKGAGIDELLEGVLLLAEMRELRASAEIRARGAVIEARQDRGRGTVATVLVQNGTLNVGDTFISGAETGRVRSMTDPSGRRIASAGPSSPVEITGFEGIPAAGDDFIVLPGEAQAKQISENRRARRLMAERALAAGPISLEEFSRRAGTAPAAELNVILKVDVHGSLEAVKTGIEKLSTEKVKVRVVHAAVGGVTESDVQLAIASRAIIIGFNIRPEPRALADAESAGIEIRFYRIIYELVDDVRNAMIGLLAPVKEERTLGMVEVRDTFTIPKIGTIAGCYVQNGSVKRGSHVRLLRDSKVVYEGRLSSLKRFKDDVKEVQTGYECGIGIENYNDVKPGDQIEVYEFREIAATLE